MLGLNRIELPIFASEVNENTIKKYLKTCISQFKLNAAIMDDLHNYYLAEQDIMKKKRYVTDFKSNEKIVENHAFNIVDFKTSYNYGEPIQYSLANEHLETDDISKINSYMREIHKESLDIENAEDLYCTGCTTRLIMPDNNTNSGTPVRIYNLGYKGGFVVYSSGYTHEKLFGVVVSKVETTATNLAEPYVYTIYAANGIYKASFGSEGAVVQKTGENPIGIINVVECKTNKYYVSPISVVRDILNSINTITSNSVDNVIDFVNSILVIYNNAITEETLEQVRKNAALQLTGTPTMPADAKYLVNSLNHADVNIVYETLVKTAYDIVGVPRSSTTVTSGGDTGQARLLGGGWSKAEVVAKKEEKFLKDFERETLDVIIAVCRKSEKSKVTISCQDVQIDFNRTRNDNILARAEALSMLYNMKMPKEVMLNIIGLTPNVHEVAAMWENYETAKLNEESQREKQITQKENEVGGDTSKE